MVPSWMVSFIFRFLSESVLGPNVCTLMVRVYATSFPDELRTEEGCWKFGLRASEPPNYELPAHDIQSHTNSGIYPKSCNASIPELAE